MPPHIGRVEIANLRVIATHGSEHARIVPGDITETPPGERSMYFRGVGFVDVPAYARTALAVGEEIVGPAVVEQIDTTTIVPPGTSATTDAAGNLVIATRDIS
jgi:N-methylhydantoinase A